MGRLDPRNDLAALENLWQHREHSAPFSAWSIGAHLHHSYLAMAGIADTLCQCQGDAPPRSFSFIRFVVFTTRKIPRGKGKAPKTVMPESSPGLELIEASARVARSALEKVQGARATAYFSHPIFGDLSRDEALHYCSIHTRHHLAICRDILAKA